MASEHAGSKGKIMIVDDTVVNLELLQNLLQRRGYSIMAFPQGKLALKAALKSPPDMLLLDINMPEMDGFEVCSHFKSEPSLEKIPVLFISALEASRDKVRAFEAGGVDYVTKPFQIEELNARVDTHLKIVRMQRELERYNQELEDLVQEKVRDIEESHLSTILAMVKLTEYRDVGTGMHIERTRTLCRMLAAKLAEHPEYAGLLSPEYSETIYNAAPLHDIGKVGVPDAILLKPGRLTEDEWEVMKTHSEIGAETLREVRKKYVSNAFVNMGIDIALSHHEKWDGSGYPEGRSGKTIPLSARIMAVADVYDALRTRRPYKEPFSHEESIGILRKDSESHFDPLLIEVFEKIEEEIKELYERCGGKEEAFARM
jgi:putative two-component system response regulator